MLLGIVKPRFAQKGWQEKGSPSRRKSLREQTEDWKPDS